MLYAGQPKKGFINGKTLPAFVRPKEDELLSSWIVRLAYAHGLKVQTFCKEILFNRNIWNRDIDRSAPDILLSRLSETCDVNFKRAYQSTLASYEGKLFLDHNIAGNTKWILPAGVFHRTRRNYSLMYCPSCLQEHVPFFRKRWRLSLSVCCTNCGLELYDYCPSCKEPVCFFRQELGKKSTYPENPISYCFNCMFDLSKSPYIQAEEQIIRMQQYLNKILDTGQSPYTQYPHLYFQVLYQICQLMNSRHPKAVNLQKIVSRNLKIPFKEKKGGYANRFDFSRLSERKEILAMAVWLLDEWPERFITCCQEASCYKSILLRDFEDAPFWYYKIVMENLYILFTPYKHLEEYSWENSYKSFVKKVTKKKADFRFI